MRHETFMKERTTMEQDKWTAISPKHYKEIVPGYSYMRIMKYLLEPFKGVEAHLVGHMCKYIFRIWYATWLMLDQGADPDALRKSVEEAINDQNV